MCLVCPTARHASPALFKWAFQNRAKLTPLINAVWSWEGVDETLEQVGGTRVERLVAASQTPCVCGGLWPLWANTALSNNDIDPGLFWHTLYMSLHDGRHEDKPVMALVGRRGGTHLSATLFVSAVCLPR